MKPISIRIIKHLRGKISLIFELYFHPNNIVMVQFLQYGDLLVHSLQGQHAQTHTEHSTFLLGNYFHWCNRHHQSPGLLDVYVTDLMFINHLSNLFLQFILVELDTVLHKLKKEFNQ
uniref:Uncharacterized protein n=1 Tax=Mastacembelus armatus TaxID=205130 RepID=A0A7N8Y3Q3_9TELE